MMGICACCSPCTEGTQKVPLRPLALPKCTGAWRPMVEGWHGGQVPIASHWDL